MKQCNHTLWLSLCSQAHGVDFLVSDRVQKIINYIPDPYTQSPSLLVLIGNVQKTIALRNVFGIKRTRRFNAKRDPPEIHLHVDPSSIFERPLLIADGDLPERLSEKVQTDKCHEIRRRSIQGPRREFSPDRITSGIYGQLLSPFVDVFCFFCDDLGGFRRIARQLALWLEHANTSTLPPITRPSIIIATEKIPLGAESEEEKRARFLEMLSEETTRSLFDWASTIDIIALLPNGSMSVESRLRPLKERLMGRSDQVRKNRKEVRSLFSMAHFAAFLNSAYEHFSNAVGEPYDFILASRTHNPIAADLAEHLSNFLSYIKSPDGLVEFAAPIIASSLFLDNYPPDAHRTFVPYLMCKLNLTFGLDFPPGEAFKVLYNTAFINAISTKVITFDKFNDVVPRERFIRMVAEYFVLYAERLREESTLAVEVHRSNLQSFKHFWYDIKSTSTCLSCLRRRPQYELRPCKHIICENCFIVFGERCENDPWLFKINRCPLCETKTPEEVVVRTHPPTTRPGVLCVDGGGFRGLVALILLKRIKDQINLPILFQRFIKAAYGTSSGMSSRKSSDPY